MAVRFHKPAFPLSRYVEVFWWVDHSGAPVSRERVYPDGAMALVLHRKQSHSTFFVDDEKVSIPVPMLAGPWSRSFHIDPSLSTGVIGVVFRAGGARALFRVAAHELHNADLALGDLDRGEADRLLNQVCSASGEQALATMQRYLTGKLGGAAPIPPAMRYAAAQLSRKGGVRGVRRIQQDTGLSHTRLIQLFREHVGLTPKLFCRVRRFRRLLACIDKDLPVNWAALAADCGYFDQSHLIRDFRTFAGITPAEYVRRDLRTQRLIRATAAAS